jgi:transposase-like protein
MDTTTKLPATLMEAIRYFSNPQVCVDFFSNLKWGAAGPSCPKCGGNSLSYLSTRCIWKCKPCQKQFSVKVGTILEDSPIGLDKWACAMWMLGNCKNGVSSYEIAKALGITQKSAWFLLHRIRYAIHQGGISKLSGEVEADETFIGGKARNMHKGKRAEKIKGRGPEGKTIVAAVLERGGRVHARVVDTRKKGDLQKLIRGHVEGGSMLYSDALKSYDGLSADYTHQVIDHAQAYVDGSVHTNGIENFWSLLKRTIGGTYVSVEPFHLFRYLDEQAFRFNSRKSNDGDRFLQVGSRIAGKRLTYKTLIGEGGSL